VTQAEAEAERAQVRTAISNILTGGQAHSSEGRALTRADLRTLYARLDTLDAIITRATRGGGAAYGVPVS
jgi:hypothetical protein